jgi:hypothetical protein
MNKDAAVPATTFEFELAQLDRTSAGCAVVPLASHWIAYEWVRVRL